MAHHIRFKEGAPAADNARRRALSILQEIELRHSKDARDSIPARELIDYLKCQNIKSVSSQGIAELPVKIHL